MNLSFVFPKVEGGSVWQRIKARLRETPWKYWLVYTDTPIGFLVLILGRGYEAMLLNGQAAVIPTIGVTIIGGLVGFAGVFIFFQTQQKIVNEYYALLAAANGFSYKEKESLFASKSRLIERGLRKAWKVSFAKHMQGSQNGIDIDFVEFSFSYGSGKSRRTERYTILSFDMHVALPDIILSQGDRFEKESWQKKIELEGDFYKHYITYVPVEHEIEALQLLTPEIMHVCMEKGFTGSIETAGNKLLVYTSKFPLEPIDVEQLFTFGSRLVTAFLPRAQAMRYVSYEPEQTT